MIREVLKKVLETVYNNGVYISLKLSPESSLIFMKYINDNLPNYKPTPEPHLTLIYSKKPYHGTIIRKEYSAIGLVSGFSIFGKDEKALVAEIESPEIVERNSELVEKYGFISDFEEYKPHITLVYGIENDFNFNSLPPFPTGLVFQNETVEQLNLNWA